MSQEELASRISSLQTADLRTFEADARRKTLARMEDYWVFSLAGNRGHPMLWSHYGEGHTGLCIHFRSGADSIFGTALQVEYQEHRPRVAFPFGDPRQLMEGATLRKGLFWQYEDEFRLIRFPGTEYQDMGLNFSGQHATFSNHALLTGITAGARMNSSEVAALLAMASAHTPAIPVWQAIEAQETYELTFEGLT